MMAIFDELLQLNWPEEFVVEYIGGRTETLFRGDGVVLTPPADDPEGLGGFGALLPKKHPKNQKQIGRYIRFTELQSIRTTSGQVLWRRV